jgi:hypothetical protein
MVITDGKSRFLQEEMSKKTRNGTKVGRRTITRDIRDDTSQRLGTNDRTATLTTQATPNALIFQRCVSNQEPKNRYKNTQRLAQAGEPFQIFVVHGRNDSLQPPYHG